MPKKNIELLKRLRTRFLRMRHPKHFEMTDVATRNECGTAMCIAGHTLDLLGFKVRFRVNGSADWFYPSGRRLPRREGSDSIDAPLNAAQRALGLTRFEAQNFDHGLFYDFSIKTPKQAAARIEKLIAEG